MRVRPTDCLLIVDVQRDFCPGGALAVPAGDEVVPVINRLVGLFPLVVASRDAHPEQSRHFERWPVHCVAGSAGAEFQPGLDTGRVAREFLKGTSGADDGYSAFEATNEDLANFLKRRRVTRLFLCGLATDYCVKATALDALSHGFETVIVEDAVRAVNASPGDGERALAELVERGAQLVASSAIERGFEKS